MKASILDSTEPGDGPSERRSFHEETGLTGSSPHRRKRSAPLRPLTTLLLIAGFTSGCLGAAVGGLAMEAGRRFLTSTAEKNFDVEYQDSLSRLIDLMMVSTMTGQTGAVPASSVTEGARTTVAPEGPPPRDAEEPPTVAFDTAPEPAAGGGGEPAMASEPLELQVSVLREIVYDGRPLPVPVEDGQVVHDGIGTAGDGDNLKIQFVANSECYVYAVWIDATAWTTPIFPKSEGGSFENPVTAGELYSVPTGNNWWHLDEERGIENLYFVASREPMAELDQTLASFVGRRRAFRSDVDQVVLNVEPAPLGRGLAGVRPGRATLVQASDGTSHEVTSTSFVSTLTASDMVVHRWFDHRQ